MDLDGAAEHELYSQTQGNLPCFREIYPSQSGLAIICIVEVVIVPMSGAYSLETGTCLYTRDHLGEWNFIYWEVNHVTFLRTLFYYIYIFRCEIP